MIKESIHLASIDKDVLVTAFKKLCQAKSMTELYEENFKQVSKYVHATSRGHEVIQIAAGLLLNPPDYAFPYYRDDAMLLSLGMRPYDLMLQLFAKKNDPFSGGRTYYCHPSLKNKHQPKIPHQSSATGMQAIPATGVAMGIQYWEKIGRKNPNVEDNGVKSICLCSFGDASITEGEVAEAFQMAALKQLPILYLVQDNEWDISAYSDEVRSQNAFEYIKGFHGIEAITIDGTDFISSYSTLNEVILTMRQERRPFLVHARVPLLNHHTSGVRMEWYRDDLDIAKKNDPYYKMVNLLIDNGITPSTIEKIEKEVKKQIDIDFERAKSSIENEANDLYNHIFAPTSINNEVGERQPINGEKLVMVNSALRAMEEIMQDHKEAVFYGQDVGRRLGGVFREATNLAQKFGEHRVFNTPIQEAFIVGSTVGMSAVGLKPIVEVQFADYLWPGLNQLFTEVSRSYYLSNGKWPVSMVLRVPIGAYGSGGPYHSSSIESVLSNIIGIKVVYPSNGADMKGLFKAAFYDPNPVVILEHKGLYWSKVAHTNQATTIEPSKNYVVPIGKARIIQEIVEQETIETITVVAYGICVHWALWAAKDLKMIDQIEIIDLRTIVPIDMDTIIQSVLKTHKCLVLTEEPSNNTFARSVASKIQESCFENLDAPVLTLGSKNVPAIPLSEVLEKEMIITKENVRDSILHLMNY